MIAIETNTPSAVARSNRPALEIRFEFVDGSRQSFIQHDPKAAEDIRKRIHPALLFTQSRIVVADEYSKSVFVCGEINRVDLIWTDSGFSKLPPDHLDLVELTEAEFRQCVPLNDPTLLQKREQRRSVGDPLVSFLDLRMRGGNPVYLMNEIVVQLPAENLSFMHRLLSKGSYGIRLREGGQGWLNLHNLIGYTVYPGVAELPADTWMADSKGAYETEL